MSRGSFWEKVFSKAPSPFEIAIGLTAIVLILATIFTEHSLRENVLFWGDGLWSLLAFMTQMCLILLGGYVLAVAMPVQRGLAKMVRWPERIIPIYLTTFAVSALACWLNWGLGLVVGAFFTVEMAKAHRRAHFPLLVAVSYMGFLFWHGGLSGSIPLVVSTPGNFSEKWIGGTISLSETTFSLFNLGLIFCLLLCLSSMIAVVALRRGEATGERFQEDVRSAADNITQETSSPGSSFYYYTLILFLGAYIVVLSAGGEFSLGLNQVNLLLIFAGLLLHRNIPTYLSAVKKGCSNLSPILIQYPLYAGIMGLIIESGLAVKISDAFVAVSTPDTYAFYMFLSAGLVNIFVPSGGGQWAVQAPVVIEGARQLGVPLWKAILAVAWGDAWTNLAQPFWALPLLSIVGLGIKEIMGYCLLALAVSGLVIGAFFLLF